MATAELTPDICYPPAFMRAVERVMRGADAPAAAPPRERVAIYFRDWWQRHGYSDLPGPIGAKLFELAVEIGAGEAERCLQRALRACGRREARDGLSRIAVRRAARAANLIALMAALRAEAASHYRLRAAPGCSEHDQPLSGWLERAYA